MLIYGVDFKYSVGWSYDGTAGQVGFFDSFLNFGDKISNSDEFITAAGVNSILNTAATYAAKVPVKMTQAEIQATKVLSRTARFTGRLGLAGVGLNMLVNTGNVISHYGQSDAGFYYAKAVGGVIILGCNAFNFLVPGSGTVLSLTLGAIDAAGGFDGIYGYFK